MIYAWFNSDELLNVLPGWIFGVQYKRIGVVLKQILTLKALVTTVIKSKNNGCHCLVEYNLFKIVLKSEHLPHVAQK